jgi:hypothetical protein
MRFCLRPLQSLRVVPDQAGKVPCVHALPSDPPPPAVQQALPQAKQRSQNDDGTLAIRFARCFVVTGHSGLPGVSPAGSSSRLDLLSVGDWRSTWTVPNKTKAPPTKVGAFASERGNRGTLVPASQDKRPGAMTHVIGTSGASPTAPPLAHDPRRTRTCNQGIKSPLLCQIELAGRRNHYSAKGLFVKVWRLEDGG